MSLMVFVGRGGVLLCSQRQECSVRVVAAFSSGLSRNSCGSTNCPSRIFCASFNGSGSPVSHVIIEVCGGSVLTLALRMLVVPARDARPGSWSLLSEEAAGG